MNERSGTDGGMIAGLARTRAVTRAMMLAERLWPRLLPLLFVICVFLIISWAGLFRLMPDWLRLAIAAALCMAALASLLPLKGLRPPSAREADQRIEKANALAHRPVTTQTDRLAAGSTDPFAAALWREHRRRMSDGLARLAPGEARTGVPARDPLALRVIPVLLLAAAFAWSFGPSGGRMTDMFSARGGAPVVPPRIDAWVTPPAYTGRAPVFLTSQANAQDRDFTVPQGSKVIVRVTGGSGTENLSFLPAGTTDPQLVAEAVAKPPKAAAGASVTSRQFETELRGNGILALKAGTTPIDAWTFTIIPDTPPAIALVGEPKSAPDGRIDLAYTITDDYGAVNGKALFELPENPAPDARPLYEAPDITLALPRPRTKDGKATSTAMLAEHPWAGASAILRLKAVDAAGQEAYSEPLSMTVPERRFTNPLARAVIEQRRMLALDANRKPRVLLLLDSVTLRPETLVPNKAHYLGLMALRSRLRLAESDDALRSTVDYMWELAVQIEDGDLTAAEKRLRDAQQALRDALENNASDEEIEKRVAELKAAMEEYMRELAERGQQDRQHLSEQQMQDMQQMSRADLDRLLQQLEDLAKSGQKDKAEQLLSQLENMMRNLQAGRQQQGRQNQAGNQMRQQMNKLGELMRKQQDLMNETFRLDQMQRDQGKQGQQGRQQPGRNGQQGRQNQAGRQGQEGQDGQQPGQQGRPRPGQQPGGQQPGPGTSPGDLADAMRGLRQGQQQLQGELGELMDSLSGMGIKPGEGFGRAQDEMGKAGEALGKPDGEQALGRQSDALDALREGAQDMMNQMQQQAQDGQEGGNQPNGNRGADNRDPLGRPRATTGPDFGETVEVPDEIDAQRAREILEAIRKRLGNALSPQLERDYLERLLQMQ
ncbi:MAG: TIGR02302 family protein [Notoacmeibacter sp.]|nr:TIGR02302 family protein [Notoacmeibacter sp.]